ncbi:NAD(P)H-binding protein [Photobacterium damselae]|uniref:NAD(P)H-binding protein n=1 Tax=Photobacterium damselae TaxID=38293 RepID=UPI000E0EA7FC|nr:NAD(P)H-binding protein [Photobacterium damselae]
MHDVSLVIAGATGLVGSEVVNAALTTKNINKIFTLTRRALALDNPKIVQCVSKDLSLSAFNKVENEVAIGVIALGTTAKKAGSKEKLREIDVDLVVTTAKKMRTAGITHLIVVSCLGASPKALSHYLRCKGEMEKLIEEFGFERVTFLHPGPLAGKRSEDRPDEKLLQSLIKFVKPLMKGSLENYIPIEASTVAKAVIQIINDESQVRIERVTTSMMNKFVS